jgi:hypothetical protein
MPTEERQKRIDVIRHYPSRLTALVSNLSEDQVNGQFIPGEWSVRQIVHHLPESHMNSFIRLKLILTEDNPPLKPYDQDAWALTPEVAGTPIDASLLILKGLHERWANLFESLTEDQWKRTGRHPEIGDVTPDDLLVIYSDHCDNHYEQIVRTLAAAKL